MQQAESNCAADRIKLCNRKNRVVQQTESNCAADRIELCNRQNQTLQQTESNCATDRIKLEGSLALGQAELIFFSLLRFFGSNHQSVRKSGARQNVQAKLLNPFQSTAATVYSLPESTVSSAIALTVQLRVLYGSPCCSTHRHFTLSSVHPAAVRKRSTLTQYSDTPWLPSCFCTGDSRSDAGAVTAECKRRHRCCTTFAQTCFRKKAALGSASPGWYLDNRAAHCSDFRSNLIRISYLHNIYTVAR